MNRRAPEHLSLKTLNCLVGYFNVYIQWSLNTANTYRYRLSNIESILGENAPAGITTCAVLYATQHAVEIGISILRLTWYA